MEEDRLCIPGDVSISSTGGICNIKGNLQVDSLKHSDDKMRSLAVTTDGKLGPKPRLMAPGTMSYFDTKTSEKQRLTFPTDIREPTYLICQNGTLKFEERSKIDKISAFAGLTEDIKYGLHQRCEIMFDSFSRAVEHNDANIMTESGCTIPKDAVYRISCQVTLKSGGRMNHVGIRKLEILRGREPIAVHIRSPESCRDVPTMLSISGIVVKLSEDDRVRVVMNTLGQTPNTLVDSRPGMSFFSIEEV